MEVIDPRNTPFAFSRGARFPPHFSRHALSLVEGQSVTVLYSTSFIFHNHLTPAPKKNTTSSTIHLLTIPVSMMFTQGRCSLGDQCKAPDGHLRPKYKCFFCSSNHYVKFQPNILHCNLLHCNFTYITL